MARTRITSVVTKLVVVFSTLAALSSVSFAQGLPSFEYDRRMPLSIRESGVRTIDGAAVHDITYASPKGGRVPAYLVVPGSGGKHPGIVFLHWGYGDRGSFLPEAVVYAKSGAESLLVDGTFLVVGSRDENAVLGLPTPESIQAALEQMIIDLRRGLDLLGARPEVDRGRIGFVGHSLGATMGGTLSGVDHRVRAYVLMAGYPQASIDQPAYRQFNKAGIALISTLDAVHYVGKAGPSAILFQFADHDEYVTKDMAATWMRAASNPKTEKVYPCDHAFNLAAFYDRADFLKRQIGIDAIDPAPLRGKTTLLPHADLARYAIYQTPRRR
jgi:dienelactone hydrolase